MIVLVPCKSSNCWRCRFMQQTHLIGSSMPLLDRIMRSLKLMGIPPVTTYLILFTKLSSISGRGLGIVSGVLKQFRLTFASFCTVQELDICPLGIFVLFRQVYSLDNQNIYVILSFQQFGRKSLSSVLIRFLFIIMFLY